MTSPKQYLREAILGISDAVEIPNDTRDDTNVILHIKLTEIMSLFTQAINDLEQRMPEKSKIGQQFSTSEIDRFAYDFAFNQAVTQMHEQFKKFREGFGL